MTSSPQIRIAVSSLFAAAVLLACFFTHGKVIAAVCVVGGILVSMVYRMTAQPGSGYDSRRSARRASRRGYRSSL